MKLNRQQINVRLPVKLLDKMRLIQKYKARTATIIIEDALEKGLAWYLKQISGELGRTKEKPLTWEQLAELVKLSETNQEHDKPKDQEQQENQEPEHVSDAQAEYTLWTLFPTKEPDFPTWLKNRFEAKMINQEQLNNAMQEYLQNPKRFEKPAKTKI